MIQSSDKSADTQASSPVATPAPPPVAPAARVPKPRGGKLKVAKDVTSVVQAVATIAALGAAAWWFLRQGAGTPHANVTQIVQSISVHEKWRLVTLDARISNVGQVPLNLKGADIYVQRVLPLESSIRQTIDKGDSPIDPEELRVPWPTIGDPYKITNLASVIAPGESEDYEFDFLVPSDICAVMLHSAFTDSGASNPYFWSADSIHVIGDCTSESKDVP